MSIENQTLEFIQEILNMDDKVLENSFDDFIKVLNLQQGFDQAVIEKVAYCRANNLTEDDLINENIDIENTLLAEFKDISKIKQKFFKEMFSIATKLNNEIIKNGLYPKVNVRIELMYPHSELPKYAHEIGDSGLDIKILDDIIVPAKDIIIIPTGFKVAVPLGYEIQVRPRSGNSLNKNYLYLTIANSPGTIDANYRNEVGIILKNTGEIPIFIEKGSKIAQLVLCPVVKLQWIEVDNINDFPTERNGGFGSTGA